MRGPRRTWRKRKKGSGAARGIAVFRTVNSCRLTGTMKAIIAENTDESVGVRPRAPVPFFWLMKSKMTVIHHVTAR